MRDEYEKDKYNFLPSKSKTFTGNSKPFTMKDCEKRMSGLFKIECVKDKIIALCSKMYCGSDMNEKALNLVVKEFKKDDNNIIHIKFENVLSNSTMIMQQIKVLDL